MKTLLFITLLMSLSFIISGQDCGIAERNRILRKVDPFDGEIMIHHTAFPMAGFYKIIHPEYGEIHALFLYTYGRTLNVYKEGVIILFTDGSRLAWPNEKIECEATSGNWKYSVLLHLNDDEVEILRTKFIDKFKLYIYDDAFNDRQRLVFRSLVNCIINTN